MINKNNGIFNGIKKILSRTIYFYPVLLVLYFILHENNAWFGLIPFPVSVKFAVYYFLFIAMASWGIWYIFKNQAKVILFTTLLVAILLFFGSVQDQAKELLPGSFFSKYRFFLIFIPVLIAATLIFLRRSNKKFYRLYQYVQITIGILVIWELVALAVNTISDKTKQNILFEKSQADSLYNTTRAVNGPNIYFIVFDGFTSSKCLQEEFSYNNAELDSFLHEKGFYPVTRSRSNYPVTPFSIASTLNFSYLTSDLNNKVLTSQDILKGNQTVSQSRLIPYLHTRGYQIFNYSVFDLKDYPASSRTIFYDMSAKVLKRQTLVRRFYKDVGWNFTGNAFVKNGLLGFNSLYKQQRSFYLQHYVYENMNGLQSVLSTRQSGPKFVYCHIMLPHAPYYFNKDGTLKDANIPWSPKSAKKDYLNQLIYSRQLVKQAINSIFKKDTLNKIIVLQGDHGFRDYGEPNKTGRFFENLNAIYFYDKNYAALSDSMTPVNTFRVVLNQYFQERLKYLPDTSIYVHDPFFDTGQLKKNQ